MQTNLIIDGNYALMKLIFPLHNANKLYGELENSLMFNFEKHIKMFPFNQIFFVSDGKFSWRKNINQQYKANRVKKEEIDWNFIFQCYSEFKNKIKSKRCVYLEYDGIEGDDWIAKVIRESNNKNISTLTISSDQDLLQLLNWKINPNIINIQYRDNLLQEKVWFPQGYNILLNEIQKTEIDLFELDWRQDFLQLIKNLQKYQHVEVNPNQQLFCKIIQGDKSDNIESVLSTKTKNGQARGIGEAGAFKIWEKYINLADEHIDFTNLEMIDLMIDLVLEYKKVENTNKNRQIVFNKIQENIKMIQLQEHYMPAEYQRILNENINSVIL